MPLVRGWWTVAEIVGAELEGYRYEVSRDHVWIALCLLICQLFDEEVPDDVDGSYSAGNFALDMRRISQ